MDVDHPEFVMLSVRRKKRGPQAGDSKGFKAICFFGERVDLPESVAQAGRVISLLASSRSSPSSRSSARRASLLQDFDYTYHNGKHSSVCLYSPIFESQKISEK